MDVTTILLVAAAVILAAAASCAITAYIQKRRLFPPEVRSVVLEHQPAEAPRPTRRSRPALLRELTQPLRPSASDRPGPAMKLYVKPSPATAEVLILDERGLLEYARIDDGPRHGDAYLGEVVSPDPGGTGLFVDIGEDRKAFLTFEEKAASAYDPGDRILCQLTGLPRGNKGYKANGRIALQGRYVTLLQDRPDLMGTKNLHDHLGTADAEQLSRQWKKRCADAGRGVVVRKDAGTVSRALYEKDFGFLMGRMNEFERSLRDPRGPAPRRLYHQGADEIALERVLSALDRADVSFDSVTVVGGWRSRFINDLKERRGRSGAGALASLKIARKSLYSREEIEAPLDEMRRKLGKPAVRVPLRSGANLVIERTEALISVDVNSAGARRYDGETDDGYALRVNSEAADMLARVLRLVNPGGIVVIDYIDMDGTGRDRLHARVQRSFERHQPVLRKPASVNLGTISPTTGVLDLTRSRDGYSLWDESRGCPTNSSSRDR